MIAFLYNNSVTYVYIIKIIGDSRYYVGSTSNPKNRFWRHINELEKNCHHNKPLQDLVNSGMGYYFEVIASYEHNSDAKAHEQRILDTGKNLLNISKHSTCGDILSYHPERDGIKAKISNTLKEGYKSGRIKSESRYGKDNSNYRHGRCSDKAFCDDCGKKVSRGNNRCMTCCKKGSKNPFYGKKHSVESIQKAIQSRGYIKPPNTVAVIVDGIEYASASEASLAHGCCAGTVLNRCRNNKFESWIIKV